MDKFERAAAMLKRVYDEHDARAAWLYGDVSDLLDELEAHDASALTRVDALCHRIRNA